MSRFVKPLLLATICLGVACRGGEPTGLLLDMQDPMVRALIAQGFRRDMIVDRGDYFIVEGDIEILKRDLLSTPGGPRPDFQWRTNNLVGNSAVQNIVVDLTGLEASWQTAIRDGMAEWSKPAMLSSVMFVEGSPGNITAIMENLGGSCGVPGTPIARAKFPSSSGNVGDTIRVSPVFTNCFNASQKKFVLAHELGHTIGFRHTDWQARGETANPEGAILVYGTPQTDANSVMNGATGGNLWSAFSTYDRLAVQYLYPSPAFIVATTTYSGPTTVVTFPNPPLPDGPTAYRVRLTVYGWQVSEGNQYGFGYEDFASAWSSATQVTLTGFSYTGHWNCSEGDPWVDGSWYREHSMWLGIRYADGFEYELPLIDVPLVMPCP